MTGLFSALDRAVGCLVPERRIYIRTEDSTRYWHIRPLSQLGMIVIFMAAVGWTGLTSYALFVSAVDGKTAERQLESSREAFDIKLAALREQQRLLEEELNRSNLRGDAVTRELSAKQRLLLETTTALKNAETELAGLRDEFGTVVAERREAREEAGNLREETMGLRLALAEAERHRTVSATTLDALSATIGTVLTERDTATAQARVLNTRVAALEGEIDEWQLRQETLVAQLESATRTSIDAFDRLFAGSDVDLSKILKETKRDYTGQGGPESDGEERSEAADPTPSLDGERVAALMTDLERVSLMRVAAQRLPFGVPTRGAERTSGFGMRRDPMRRSSRMHKGVDYAAPVGTPIYATAEGVVTFSGRQRGYGIVVKIRHAFGFETVYAHLSKSRVEVGQRVERHQRVADMGSTGRSTGSHLHYEVRIDGVPINPSKFIGAAKNVL